jgi:membrane protein implicated in regulation of membrane protease activity
MSTRVWWSAGVGLVVAAMLVSGCASTGTSAMPLPPAKMLQSTDLASLAGEWQGTLKAAPGATSVSLGRSAVGRVTVAPDGSYTSNVGGAPGVGKARIEGGKVIFEGSVTRGTATLYEGDGRRVLKGEGTWVGYDGNTEFELTKR